MLLPLWERLTLVISPLAECTTEPLNGSAAEYQSERVSSFTIAHQVQIIETSLLGIFKGIFPDLNLRRLVGFHYRVAVAACVC